MKLFFSFCLLFLTSAFLPTHETGWKSFLYTGKAQGTTYRIQFYSKGKPVAQSEIDQLLNEIDSSLSIYKSYSLIRRFNEIPDRIRMDKHLRRIVKKSLQVTKETNGLFDITVAPLVAAWGFGPDANTEPPEDPIELINSCVGPEKIKIRGNWLIKETPCVQIDVNGIAQGYTVDCLATLLENRGIRNYLVELGGEIRVKGRKKPDNLRFSIGIEAPSLLEFETASFQKVIYPRAGAITTSGNYRKYRAWKGQILPHLIDPRTGYPVQNELISVTVCAPTAIVADGYDNALMLMGLENALNFVASRKDLSAFFIYRRADGQVCDTASLNFYSLLNH